jgi:LysM repeat protein
LITPDAEDAELAALLDDAPGEAGATTDAAAPEAPQEVRVVKEGDTLFGIAQEVGVPLQKLAEDNGITDVNVIQPGQELKIVKPGGPDTDISAAPAPETEGFDIGGETLTIAGETGNVLDQPAGGSTPILPNEATENIRQQQLQTNLAGSGEGTPTDTETISELDFEAKPVAEASLDGEPVTEEPGEPVDTMPALEVTEASSKQAAEIVGSTLSEDSKPIYDDVIKKIDDLGYEAQPENFYEKIADDINKKIGNYNTKISEIAEEKQKPTFEGWNKFLAVLGAAMGAYGSAMTGTPNFALNIMNDAIDRDAQAFLKSKEVRTKSLENQRMDLIMRRGELLQMAQNRTSQLMQSEAFKLSAEETKANVQAISDNLIQAEEKNKQDLKLVLAGHIVKLITSEQQLKASLNKEQSKRLVSHMTFKDGKGNDFIAPAYVAPTEKEAIKDRDKQEATENILLITDELEPLYDEAARFSPQTFSQTRVNINSLEKKLESAVKTALGMGAHYTPYEVTIVAAQIPSANDWTRMVGTARKKINALRDSMVIDMKAARQGLVTDYSKATHNKTIPGLKKGVTRVSN